MRWLADVNIPSDLVAFLRSEGESVRLAADESPGMPDVDLIRQAFAAGEIVLTADKDFGNLVFSQGEPAIGVVLLRLPGTDTAGAVERFRAAWPTIRAAQPGHFITIADRAIRRRALPAS